jgi:hypothetical protein
MHVSGHRSKGNARDRKAGDAMERGSSKHGPDADDRLQDIDEPLERSLKEPHVADERAEEEREDEDPGSGHRIAGSGSSADSYTLTDRGEEGGSSHPKPKPEGQADEDQAVE